MNVDLANATQTRALKALRAEFGSEFVISKAGGRVDSIETIFKFNFKSSNPSEILNEERKKFETYAMMVSLKPEDYRQPFTIGGYTYLLIEINPSRPKFPIVGERMDGKRFKFTTETVRLALGRKK